MVRKNHLRKLREHARRTNSQLQFEVIKEGPEDERVTIKAVLNGQAFIGVGSTSRKAKEKAAKDALRTLSEKENQGLTTKNALKNPNVPVNQKTRPKTKPVQKHGLLVKSTATAVNPNISTLLSALEIGDNEEGATAAGGKRKTLLFDETCDSETKAVPSTSVLSGDGGSTRLMTSQNSLEFWDILPESDAKTPDSSNHSIVQDGISLEESNRREMLSAQSLNIWSKTEFVRQEKLGKGAFGRVYKATHTLLGKDYAIKIVPYEENALREAEALANLHRHENIVQFFHCWIGESGPQSESSDNSCSTSPSSVCSSAVSLFIQMELCDSDTLRDWIDSMNWKESGVDSKRRRLSLRFMLEILSGVEYIHSKRFIHRDLKPTNIMFGLDGKVKIGDFGLVAVKDADDQLERSVNKGTESYMAPEQKSELTYDRKVDIFSLGLINFELVWKISSVHERCKMWGNVRAQKLPEGFSHSFWEEYRIIKSMLSEKPEDRPEANEVRTYLAEHKDASDITSRCSRSV